MRRILRRAGVGLQTWIELLRSVWRGPRWWLVPVLLILLPLALILVFLQMFPAVSPFVYAVF